MTTEAAELKSSIPFFRGIDGDVLERIAPFVTASKRRRGDIIFLEGTEGDDLYFIGSGAVAIHTYDKGKKVTLALLREGDHFGEMALLKPGLLRSATAEALMPTRLYSLRRADFRELIERDRNLTYYLLDYTMDRLRRANEHIYDLSFLNVRARLVKKLLLLAGDYAPFEGASASRIPVKITHQQLAEMIGAARETVSKLLQELQDRGAIDIRNKMIRLTDEAQLRAIMHGDA